MRKKGLERTSRIEKNDEKKADAYLFARDSDGEVSSLAVLTLSTIADQLLGRNLNISRRSVFSL